MWQNSCQVSITSDNGHVLDLTQGHRPFGRSISQWPFPSIWNIMSKVFNKQFTKFLMMWQHLSQVSIMSDNGHWSDLAMTLNRSSQWPLVTHKGPQWLIQPIFPPSVMVALLPIQPFYLVLSPQALWCYHHHLQALYTMDQAIHGAFCDVNCHRGSLAHLVDQLTGQYALIMILSLVPYNVLQNVCRHIHNSNTPTFCNYIFFPTDLLCSVDLLHWLSHFKIMAVACIEQTG